MGDARQVSFCGERQALDDTPRRDNGTMHLRPPRIGITATDSASLHSEYLEALERAGAQPVVLVPEEGVGLERLDGLVLSGGPDLDPALYGQLPHRETICSARQRDDFELDLARQALEAGLPLLGICRGAQVLSVACGGTLIQHLPDWIGHDGHSKPAERNLNFVRMEPGSLAASIVGDSLVAPCHHHQAVGLRNGAGPSQLGEGLVATGWSDDGVIEAVEAPEKRFALGVQWHPEDALDWDPLRYPQGPGAPAWDESYAAKHLRLFETLAEAAAQMRASSRA